MPSSSANAATSSAQLDAKLTDSLPNLTSAGPVQAVDTFGIVLTGAAWGYVPVFGHSIEPTGTGARDQTVGRASVIAGVQGALPPRRYSQHEVTESFIRFPGFEAFEDMVRKLYASSKVLESIRATARLALSPPSGNTAPCGAREPDPGAGPRAAARCAARSSRPARQPSVIPSAPALE
jgi:hypothetical protein